MNWGVLRVVKSPVVAVGKAVVLLDEGVICIGPDREPKWWERVWWWRRMGRYYEHATDRHWRRVVARFKDSQGLGTVVQLHQQPGSPERRP